MRSAAIRSLVLIFSRVGPCTSTITLATGDHVLRVLAKRLAGRGQPACSKVGRGVGRESRNEQNVRLKSRARLASPQSRPTAPVNGAGGMTGCRNDAQAPDSFPSPDIFLPHA